MTDLAQLIGRLQAASEGSRDLDRRVALAAGVLFLDEVNRLYALDRDDGGRVYGGLGEDILIRPVTTSLDAIVALIERILPGVAGWSVALDTYDNSAALTDMAGETRGAVAKTLPLAACLAFLRALQAQQETSEDE